MNARKVVGVKENVSEVKINTEEQPASNTRRHRSFSTRINYTDTLWKHRDTKSNVKKTYKHLFYRHKLSLHLLEKNYEREQRETETYNEKEVFMVSETRSGETNGYDQFSSYGLRVLR